MLFKTGVSQNEGLLGTPRIYRGKKLQAFLGVLLKHYIAVTSRNAYMGGSQIMGP